MDLRLEDFKVSDLDSNIVDFLADENITSEEQITSFLSLVMDILGRDDVQGLLDEMEEELEEELLDGVYRSEFLEELRRIAGDV